MLRIYWNLAYIDILNITIFFKVKKKCYEIFAICLAQISSKIKNTQNLLKIGLLNISNMPISISNWKKKNQIFTTCYPKISPKIKDNQHFIEIWLIWYFKYTDFDFNVKNNFYQVFLSNFSFHQISLNSKHFPFWDQFESKIFNKI